MAVVRVAGEAHGRGRAAGAVLQVRVRVLRGGRGRALAGRGGRQGGARAVPAAGRAAAPRRAALPQVRIHTHIYTRFNRLTD